MRQLCPLTLKAINGGGGHTVLMEDIRSLDYETEGTAGPRTGGLGGQLVLHNVTPQYQLYCAIAGSVDCSLSSLFSLSESCSFQPFSESEDKCSRSSYGSGPLHNNVNFTPHMMIVI